jgi:hypothetical protein
MEQQPQQSRPLPQQTSSPAAAAADMILVPHPVPGDGNCLFASVALVLINWIDYSAAKKEIAEKEHVDPSLVHVPAATIAAFAPPRPEEVAMLANYLRSRVAQRVLDPTDDDANRAISNWFQLWVNALKEKDAEMAIEMRHMNGVEGDSSNSAAEGHSVSFSAADRRVLFRNMMDARIYWGDEFALRSLEAVLGCMLCVVNESYQVVKREYSSAPPTLARAAMLSDDAVSAANLGGGESGSGAASFLGLLVLRNNHYEPLRTHDNRYVWEMAALPVGLSNLVAAWVGK